MELVRKLYRIESDDWKENEGRKEQEDDDAHQPSYSLFL